MMEKLIACVAATLFLFLIFSNNTFATINKITITDDVDDIIELTDEREEITNISRPNIDIYKIVCEQDGKKLKLSLQLKEGGKIAESNYTLYFFELITTHNSYEISFGGALNELDHSETLLSIVATDHFSEKRDEVADGEYEDINTNKLTITFDLLKEEENIISCHAMTAEITTSYMDEANVEALNEIFPNAGGEGGSYKAKRGETVTFNGSLEEELSPTDYEWLWVIVDKNFRTVEMLEGQTPQYSFLIPGNYTGLLFVYNETGAYGMVDFEVEVYGETTTDSGTQEDKTKSGNLIIFILIIVVIIVVGVAVVLLILKKR